MTARAPRLLAALTAAALALATLTACDDDEEIQPSERGPQNHAGQATCVYIDSPAECEDSGVPADLWFKAPQDRPEGEDDWLLQLFIFQMVYSQWFASPMYVDRYIVVDHRDAYRSRWSSFDRRYANEEVNYRKRAKYKNQAGEIVPPEKVNPKKFAPPRNTGGDRNTQLCKVLRLVVEAPHPKPPQPKPPVVKPPAPKDNKPAVGGDRDKGGKAQNGC